MRLDGLDERGGDLLPAADGVVGAAQVVVDHRGVRGDRGPVRREPVVGRLRREQRPRPRGQSTVVEQVGQRATAPRQHSARLGAESGRVGGEQHRALGGRHRPRDVEERVQTGQLSGEHGGEAVAVGPPVGGDPDVRARHPDLVEPVGVQLAEPDAPGQAEPGEDRGQQAVRAAVAEVVHADVELVGAAPAEHVAVAARHVVVFQHEHAVPGDGEVACAHQPADTRADDDRVPAFTRAHREMPPSMANTAPVT